EEKVEEKSVEIKPEPAAPVQEPSGHVVRQVRRIIRPSERPVRRIIRRRIPGRKGEEIEEIVEYIDEQPEAKPAETVYYGSEADTEYESEVEYEDANEEAYDDEDIVEYQEEVRVETREVPQPPVEKRVAPESPREQSQRIEPAPVQKRPEAVRPVIKAPIEPEPEPEPEPEIEESIEYADEETDNEEAVVYEDEAYDEVTDIADDEPDDRVEEDNAEAAPVAAIIVEPVKAAPAIEQPAMEIKADDIISAYENEGAGADARYANKVLRISGIIQKVDIRQTMSVYALVLEASESHPLRQTVRCVFPVNYGTELTRFVPGQTVTVQGKYDGSIINISMRDCILINEA
ncbi:MAG: hypothetical protein GX631_04820, partial [Dehalococcoidales bacterium]|nr:hypothetical protein [Dehalococcoidales bacterium]